MNKDVRGQLAESFRPWVSLAITIHFFAIVVSLAANLSPSELERRILKVLTPYTVALHQNYQGVPMEMTRGTEIDQACEFEIRRAGPPGEPWQTVQPPRHSGMPLDLRWRTFERMTGIIATEQNEPLVHLLFEQCVRRAEQSGTELPGPEQSGPAAVESVRLVRRATLSYAADQAYLAGELPQSENQDRTLFECRVVRLDKERIRLIPVLESLRTSKSLVTPSMPPSDSPSFQAPRVDSAPTATATEARP